MPQRQDQGPFTDLKAGVIVYWLAVAFLGWGLAIWLLIGDESWNQAEVAVFAAIYPLMYILLITPMPVGVYVSSSFPILVTCMITLGPVAAIAIAFPIVLLHPLLGYTQPLRIVFNLGQMAISIMAASLMYGWVAGEPAGALTGIPQLMPVLAATLTYDLVNGMLVIAGLSLQTGQPFFGSLYQGLIRNRHMAGPLYHFLAYLVLLAYTVSGWPALVAATFCMISLHYFFSLHTTAQRAYEHALTDELTQVSNYRYLVDWLNNWDQMPKDERPVVSLLFVDLNGLKGINDKFGHDAGNAVLKSFSNLLQQFVRSKDKVVRAGGDEFVVLLPGTTRQQAEQVRERIMTRTAKELVTGKWGQTGYTAAIGLASYPDDAPNLRDVLHLADADMYRDKPAKTG